MFYQPSNYPDIFTYTVDNNPVIHSPNSDYDIEFALTKEGTYDLEEYKKFIDSAINEFRHSRTYSHYKAYLYSLGIDRCAFHPYIRNTSDGEEMASLEMHHCILTIYDIAILITEHMLNKYGVIHEFDLSELLRIEHVNNRIPIVMLCKNCHQQYHNNYLYVHPDAIFGKWWELLERYDTGLCSNNGYIANRILIYLKQALKYEVQEEKAKKLLKLRDKIYDWSNIQL